MPENKVEVSVEIVLDYKKALEEFNRAFSEAFGSKLLDKIDGLKSALDNLSKKFDELPDNIASALSKTLKEIRAFKQQSTSELDDLLSYKGIGVLAGLLNIFKGAGTKLAAKFLGAVTAVDLTARISYAFGSAIYRGLEQAGTQAEDQLQDILKKVITNSSSFIDQVDAIYRQPGESVQHFAKLGLEAFECLRKGAIDEVDAIYAQLHKLTQMQNFAKLKGPFNQGEQKILENQRTYLIEQLHLGQTVLDFIDKHRSAIDDLIKKKNEQKQVETDLREELIGVSSGIIDYTVLNSI